MASISICRCSFQECLDLVQVGVVLGDLKGHILQTNRKFEQLLGYGPHELNRLSLEQLIYPEDLEAYHTLLTLLQTGSQTTHQQEQRYQCKGGQIIWVQINIEFFQSICCIDRRLKKTFCCSWSRSSVSPIKSLFRVQKKRNLCVPMFVATIVDITERKHLEMALAKSEAQSCTLPYSSHSEFLSNISHELKTPLNGILGFSQLLKRDQMLTSLQREYVQIIEQSGEHLLLLINDLLTISKIETGELKLQAAEFELGVFLKDIVNMNQIQCQQKGLELFYEIPTVAPTVVMGDANRLRQVLMNLFSNMIKLTEQGAIGWVISIQDKRFYFQVKQRLSGLESTLFKSTLSSGEDSVVFGVKAIQEWARQNGLNLTISQRLLTVMESELVIRKISSHGICFEFMVNLPVVYHHSSSFNSPIHLGRIVGLKQGQSCRVLVIDDEVVNRTLLTSVLTPLNFIVYQAEDGQSGLEAALTYLPDVVLLDILMPKLNGLEVVKKMCTYKELAHMIIIANSATPQHRSASLDCGCHDFLTKPIVIEQLLKKLQVHLKLDWLCETVSPKSVPREISEFLERPPATVIARFHQLALIGNIIEVIEYSHYFEQSYPQFLALAIEIRRLAESFQLKQLIQLIEPFLDHDHCSQS